MKSIPLLLTLCSVLCIAPASAQWQTTNYTLKGGWSSIYLTGDAKQAALEEIFPASVTEVWRWNPNPTEVQFLESPLIPSAGTPEWSVWKRGFPLDSNFSQLTGGTAYLVKSTGTAANSYAVPIKQSTLPPSSSWVRNGANLLGFPTLKSGSSYPTIASYFATFPAAFAANSKVFKYVGGELGPNNPIQVFSPPIERLDRTQAYWFSAEVVGNFYAPMDIKLSSGNALDYGRSGSIITITIGNRSDAVANLTFEPVDSESAPIGQTPIAGPVPITRREFNSNTATWGETRLTAASTVAIAPHSSVEFQFGIDRPAMTGTDDALYASFLRLTDSGGLMDVALPIRARKSSLTGLWIGDVKLSAVGSKAPGSPGATTPEAFPLRTLMHIANGGSANLLSQVFVGPLAVAPNDMGISTRESLLKQDSKAGSQRLVAAHLPLDQVIPGDVAVGLPSAVTFLVTVGYDDPTNPFVHQYHPDHDNKNARMQPIGKSGVESYDITRSCTFTFTAAPPAGSSVTSGWGNTTIGGTYSEIITGIHKEPITISGTFELNRASEIGTLSQ